MIYRLVLLLCFLTVVSCGSSSSGGSSSSTSSTTTVSSVDFSNLTSDGQIVFSSTYSGYDGIYYAITGVRVAYDSCDSVFIQPTSIWMSETSAQYTRYDEFTDGALYFSYITSGSQDSPLYVHTVDDQTEFYVLGLYYYSYNGKYYDIMVFTYGRGTYGQSVDFNCEYIYAKERS